MSSSDTRIQTALESAQKSIREATAEAVDATASALKPLVRTAIPSERPTMTQALAVVQQSRQPLLAAFGKALREAVDEDVSPEGETVVAPRDPTDWMAIGLVDEDKFEDRLAFERVGQFIAHECEAELRELSAYTGELLDLGWADPSRNPLRGQIVAAALNQAVEAVAEGGECGRVLVKELGQALAKTLPQVYLDIIKDFSARGFRQVDLAVRPSPSSLGGGGGGGGGSPAAAASAAAPGFEVMRDLWEKSMMGRMPVGAAADAARAWETSVRNPQAVGAGGPAGGAVTANPAALFERLMQDALAGATWPGAVTQADGTVASGGAVGGVSDADLMHLLRRLNNAAPAEPGQGAGSETRDTRMGAEPTFFGSALASMAGGAVQGAYGGMAPTNLIRAHHDELVQASTGEVDHMVIEVVASLFDQILADVRVPPQIAREIARLQMPVLRVALRDTSFFSSRKHAVRRFINRISTLAASFGQFESGPGRDLLGRVNALVTEIIEGDFDQVPLYVRKLAELEDFVADASRAEFESSPAAATLRAKEAEWQIAQVFSARLHEAYEHLPIPDYLKTFLADVWSRVIVAAVQDSSTDPAREKRFRRAAFHLVASIQPKRSAQQRSEFLAGLRGLTGTLDEGLALIGWPKEEHDAFFGKLIADHSGSLKAVAGSELDHNMLLRQLDAAARTPLPAADDTSPSVASAAEAEAFEPRFSAKEAQRVGLVDDAAVDWSSPAPIPVASESDVAPVAVAPEASGAELDLDLATRPAPLDLLPVAPIQPAARVDSVAPADPDAFPSIVPPPLEVEKPAPAALPAPPAVVAMAEPEEPTEGSQLRHHLQVGVSYRLHLKDQWEKVRLTHMNASRTFFLFTHGNEDRSTISMTARMLGRLCDTGRLKVFEDKPLLDRATERMRSQTTVPATSSAVRRPELSAV
ncbi:MAG: DUF1631 family protein [Caldimonas sp.]